MAQALAKKPSAEQTITVSPPNIQAIQVRLVGTAPYMQARFSQKAMKAMMAKMDGSVKKASKARVARNFEQDMKEATHVSTEDWPGIPAASIRAALISACRLVDF